MTDLRTAAQQALEALESDPVALNAINNACAVLRAALAQQADTTDPGHDVDVLREHVRHLERRIRELHAQQDEPQGCATEEDCTKQPWCRIRGECQRKQAEPDAYGYASYLAVAIWEKYYKDTAPHWKPLDDLVGVLTQIDNMTSGLTRLAQQAEPLNLRDPAVRKRLASQWGYVPAAAQAEPVEQLAELQAMLRAEVDRLIAAGIQPQRRPLTQEESDNIYREFTLYQDRLTPSVLQRIVRAVEKASWEKNHGQA